MLICNREGEEMEYFLITEIPNWGSPFTAGSAEVQTRLEITADDESAAIETLEANDESADGKEVAA